MDTDVLVIGAGVVGLAIAHNLAKKGHSVFLAEKEAQFAMGTSSRNSEVIHAGIYYQTGSLKASLCLKGKILLYEHCKKYNVAYKKIGKLFLAVTPNEISRLERIQLQAKENGIEDLVELDKKKLHQLESELLGTAALLSPSSGIIDSHGVMAQLEREATSKDCLVYYNSEVVSMEKIDSNYNLSLKDQDDALTSPIVINSTGLWCDAVASMLGIDKYKIHYCKGDYYQSNKYRDLKCLIYPLPDKIGLGIHTVLQLDGSVSFGPNAYYVDEIDYSIDDRHLDAFHSSINEYLELDKEELKIDYSGIRPKPFAEDEEPKDFVINNEVDLGFPNLINLIGIESPGLTCSLAIGNYVKDILISQDKT